WIAPNGSDTIMQILLIAGRSSKLGVGYGTINKNYKWSVKKPTTRGLSAVVQNLTKSSLINFDATQRLHAGDLWFAYLVGLIEGDGWFSVTTNGEYLKYEMGIELHIRDVQLLYKIKELLGVGTIHIRSNRETVIYRIRKKSHLKAIVLPIFDKYPMFSNKQYDYLMFKELILKDLKFSKDINKYIRPIQEINTIETILEKPYFKSWLIGFIEAEGCFINYTPSKSIYKEASFEISQTNGSVIIEAIKKELSFTPQVYRDKTNNFKLKVTSVRAIENIIKYLQKSPIKLMGHKRLQYLLWLKELRTIPRYSNKFKIPDQY
uniref:LAGLIDADG homing endonuclease n=1 Tax=Cyathus striatus TaxID=68777 RepID=UPI0023F0EE2E